MRAAQGGSTVECVVFTSKNVLYVLYAVAECTTVLVTFDPPLRNDEDGEGEESELRHALFDPGSSHESEWLKG